MMIVHGLIVLILVNSIIASYDNDTSWWVDYETQLIKHADDPDNTIYNYRSAIHIDDIKYRNNLVFNKSINEFDDKIVGGSLADIHNFPYQISIQEKGFGHFCGGTIITQKWIITAAHCFYGSNTPISDYFLRAGSSYHAKGGVIAFPRKIYVAKKYNPNTNNYDIALIKLKRGFSRKTMLKYPIRRIYVRKTMPRPKTPLIVTGWGTVRSGGPNLPPHLRKAEVPLMRKSYCNTKTNIAGLVTKTQFCAGVTQGGRDSCQGDSGGPITAYKKLVGIVSWGIGCAARNSPGVYTKVPQFVPYIKKLIRVG